MHLWSPPQSRLDPIYCEGSSQAILPFSEELWSQFCWKTQERFLTKKQQRSDPDIETLMLDWILVRKEMELPPGSSEDSVRTVQNQ